MSTPDESRTALALRDDLRELADHPLTYGQETHGELHADALAHIERHHEVLFMAATAAHEFARHGGDIDRCVHHPCDLPEIKECVREKRERTLADV